MPDVTKVKLFISHASEDKADFVEPLVAALKGKYEVWYDKDKMKAGDSLFRKIGEGVKECDYGIAVFSKAFFAKKWTQEEIQGLYALETTTRKVILPIWKDVTSKDVAEFSPLLVDKFALQASSGIERIVEEINAAIAGASAMATIAASSPLFSILQDVEDQLGAEGYHRRALTNPQASSVIRNEVREILESICRSIIEYSGKTHIHFDINHQTEQYWLRVLGPYKTTANIGLDSFLDSQVEYRRITLSVEVRKWDKLMKMERRFKPFFKRDGSLAWMEGDVACDKLQVATLFCELIAKEIVSRKAVHDARG